MLKNVLGFIRLNQIQFNFIRKKSNRLKMNGTVRISARYRNWDLSLKRSLEIGKLSTN